MSTVQTMVQEKERQQATRQRLLLLGALLAGFGLRLFHLGAESLWYDETVSVYLAQKSIPAMLTHTAGDIHPPGYYFLLHLWQAVAQPTVAHGLEFLYALPSLFFGVLLIALLYPLGRKLFGSTIGLLAAWLTVIHPFHIWYSQEVRMYTLGALLGLLCLWALLNLCEIAQPEATGRSRWLLLYVLCAAAGMYTLYYFVFLLLTLNLLALLLLRTQATRLWVWIGAQCAAFLLWLPWFPIFYRQALDPPVPPWRVPWETVSGLVGSLAESFSVLLVGQSPPFAQNWLWATLALLTIALFFYAKSDNARQSLSPRWLLVIYIFAPILLIYLISYFVTPLYHARYLFTYAAPIPLLLAVVIESIAQRFRHLASLALVGIIAISSASLYEFWTNPLYRADDHRGAVADLALQWRPGDAILVNAGWAYTPIAVYWPSELSDTTTSLPPRLAPLQRLGDQEVLDLSRPTIVRTGSVDGSPNLGWGDPASDFFAISKEKALSALQQLAAESRTIWHYRIYDTVSDPEAAIRGWLEAQPMVSDQPYAGRDYLRVQRFLSTEVNSLTHGKSAGESSIFTQIGVGNIPFGNDLVLASAGILTRDNGNTSNRLISMTVGENIYVNLDWLPQYDLMPLLPDLSMSLRIYTINDELVAQSDEAPLIATHQWKAQQHYSQTMALEIPVATKPGSYSLQIVVYPQDNGEPLTLVESPQTVQGQRLQLAQVELQPARQIPDFPSIVASFDYIDLLSAHLNRTEVAPGETLNLEMLWRPQPNPYRDSYTSIVELIDASGQSKQSWKMLIGGDEYPSVKWTTLQPVRDIQHLAIPNDLPGGTYTLQLRLERNSDQLPIPASNWWGLIKYGSIDLGKIQVR